MPLSLLRRCATPGADAPWQVKECERLKGEKAGLQQRVAALESKAAELERARAQVRCLSLLLLCVVGRARC